MVDLRSSDLNVTLKLTCICRICNVGGHKLHIMCKKNEEIVMRNFAARSAAVFQLSTKNLRGGGGMTSALPPVRGLTRGVEGGELRAPFLFFANISRRKIIITPNFQYRPKIELCILV